MRLHGAILVSVGIILGGASGCSKKADAPAETKIAPKTVRVMPAQQQAVEQTVYGTGTLAAQDRAVLSAKIPGRVDAVLVDLGSAVHKGDLLVTLQKQEFELKRQQAEAALWQSRARLGLALTGEEDKVEPEKTSIAREAKALLGEATKNRERLVKLRDQGIIADAEVETAEAQFQVAGSRYEESLHEAKNRIATLQQRKAELALTEHDLKETEFRAPFDGVIELRQTSAGEFLNVGTPVLTTVRIDPIRLRLEVAEKDAPQVRMNQRVYAQIEGLDQKIEGRISRLSPVISAGNRMLLAEADLPNPSGILRPGSFAKGDVVVVDNASAVFVPATAVVNFAGLQKVFVVESGKAVEKEVTLKRKRGNQIEISSGIKPGDLVVVEPGSLRNGQPVVAGNHDDT